MKQIIDKNLFGLTLSNLDGENTQARIIELNGEITEDIVTGYARVGYKVKNEVINAAVSILKIEGAFRVELSNIDQLFVNVN